VYCTGIPTSPTDLLQYSPNYLGHLPLLVIDIEFVAVAASLSGIALTLISDQCCQLHYVIDQIHCVCRLAASVTK